MKISKLANELESLLLAKTQIRALNQVAEEKGKNIKIVVSFSYFQKEKIIDLEIPSALISKEIKSLQEIVEKNIIDKRKELSECVLNEIPIQNET